MKSVEDFRPQLLAELVGQTEAVDTLKGLVKRQLTGGAFPHLIADGVAGTGKTTALIATAREILGVAFKDNFREMNASKDNGVDVVRRDIAKWVDQAPVEAPFKILLLDECDLMTPEAQGALKRVMEKGCENTRFFLACNRASKVMDPIKSRCLPLAFRPLDDNAILAILQNVATLEGLVTETGKLQSIIRRSHGDARRAINYLLGGSTDVERMERLDEQVATLWNKSVGQITRVENFIAFLRTDGVSDWEDVLTLLGEQAIERGRKGEMTLEALDQLQGDIATTMARISQASAPIIMVRGLLYTNI